MGSDLAMNPPSEEMSYRMMDVDGKKRYIQRQRELLDERERALYEDTPVEFEYYLHGDSMYELAEHLKERYDIPEELAEEIAQLRPFYEVTIKVSYNPKNKEFTVLEAHL